MEVEMPNDTIAGDDAQTPAAAPLAKSDRRHGYKRSYRVSFTSAEADQLTLAAQEHGTTLKRFVETLIHIVLRDKLAAAIIDGESITGE